MNLSILVFKEDKEYTFVKVENESPYEFKI